VRINPSGCVFVDNISGFNTVETVFDNKQKTNWLPDLQPANAWRGRSCAPSSSTDCPRAPLATPRAASRVGHHSTASSHPSSARRRPRAPARPKSIGAGAHEALKQNLHLRHQPAPSGPGHRRARPTLASSSSGRLAGAPRAMTTSIIPPGSRAVVTQQLDCRRVRTQLATIYSFPIGVIPGKYLRLWPSQLAMIQLPTIRPSWDSNSTPPPKHSHMIAGL
jgi:hypothetical protein